MIDDCPSSDGLDVFIKPLGDLGARMNAQERQEYAKRVIEGQQAFYCPKTIPHDTQAEKEPK